MALIKEVDRTLPYKYTMSNKKLILIAHVRDETIFFYDQLGPETTIVLLTEPRCFMLKKIFLDFMNDLGTTVIDLRENETFDLNYQMSERSFEIIRSLLIENKFQYIITHPKYSLENDPQNRILYDTVFEFIKRLGTKNHYTYNKIGKYGTPNIPCGIKKGIIELYCKALTSDNSLDKKLYSNYSGITENISGIRKINNPM